MVHEVHEYAKEGSHEISARELLNTFAHAPRVAGACVHHVPGAVTILLVDDPPVALAEQLRERGWTQRVVWRRGTGKDPQA